MKNRKAEPIKADEKETTEPDNQLEKVTPKVVELIQATIEDLADDDGWAFLGEVGSLLQKKQPNFDSRNYGFQKLTPMIQQIGLFEIEQRDTQKGRFKLIYVRNKKQEKPSPPPRATPPVTQVKPQPTNTHKPTKEVIPPKHHTPPTKPPVVVQPKPNSAPKKEDVKKDNKKDVTKIIKAFIKFEREELILLQDNTDQMTKASGLDARISSLTGKRKVGFLKEELANLEEVLVGIKDLEKYQKSVKMIELLLKKFRGGIRYIENYK